MSKTSNDYGIQERQKRLYNLLESIYEKDETDGLKPQEICILLPNDYDFINEDGDKHNSSAFRRIRKDIHDLNENLTDSNYFKTIICKNGRYKIATAEEYRIYSHNKWKNIVKRINHQKLNDMKYNVDGSLRMFLNEEGELTLEEIKSR